MDGGRTRAITTERSPCPHASEVEIPAWGRGRACGRDDHDARHTAARNRIAHLADPQERDENENGGEQSRDGPPRRRRPVADRPRPQSAPTVITSRVP